VTILALGPLPPLSVVCTPPGVAPRRRIAQERRARVAPVAPSGQVTVT
jgi:hypothetical protein